MGKTSQACEGRRRPQRGDSSPVGHFTASTRWSHVSYWFTTKQRHAWGKATSYSSCRLVKGCRKESFSAPTLVQLLIFLWFRVVNQVSPQWVAHHKVDVANHLTTAAGETISAHVYIQAQAHCPRCIQTNIVLVWNRCSCLKIATKHVWENIQ